MSTFLNYTDFYGDRPINILQLNPRNVSHAFQFVELIFSLILCI